MLYVVPKTNSVELTHRESEVLKLLLKAYNYDQIGKLLFISPRTVEKHACNIRKKWKCQTIVGLILESFRRGLSQHFIKNNREVMRSSPFFHLTSEQIRLVQYMIFDLTTREIARIKNVSQRSVEGSVMTIRNQLHVKNDLELAVLILASGLEINIPVPIQIEHHLWNENQTTHEQF